MATNTKSYQPLHPLSVRAAEDLPAFRFISHTGNLCGADAQALGVSEVNWVAGEMAAAYSLGTIAVETSTTINAGDNVSSDSAGKAKPASNGAVNGRALESAAANSFVKIKLVP